MSEAKSTKKRNGIKAAHVGSTSESQSMMQWLTSQIANAAQKRPPSDSGIFAKVALDYLYSSGWRPSAMDIVSKAYTSYLEMKRKGDEKAAVKALAELKTYLDQDMPA